VWGSGKELQRASLPYVGETNVVNMTSIYGTVRQINTRGFHETPAVMLILAVSFVSSLVRLKASPPSSLALLLHVAAGRQHSQEQLDGCHPHSAKPRRSSRQKVRCSWMRAPDHPVKRAGVGNAATCSGI
jgi:hypothetical protein